jgi:hypothetical protein
MWKRLVDIYLRRYEFCVFSSLIFTRLAASHEMFVDISCIEFCTYQTTIIETTSRIDLRSKVQDGIQCSSSNQTVSATWHHVENLLAEFHLNRPTNVETGETNLFSPEVVQPIYTELTIV